MDLFFHVDVPLSTLRYFIRQQRIPAESLLILYSSYYSQEEVDFLLNEVVVNINIQDDRGSSPLLVLLRDSVCWPDEIFTHARFLLENGADPLLANKEGLAPLDQVRSDNNKLQRGASYA